MYLCKVCGNKKSFLELNCIETEVILDEDTGEVIWTQDNFLGFEEVHCGVCNASSEDGKILDQQTMEPVVWV